MRHSLRSSAWILGSVSLIAFASGGAACGGGDTATGGNATTGTAGAPSTGGGGSGGTGGNQGGGGAAPQNKITVLFTSDEHSHLFAFSPEFDDFPITEKPGDGTLVGGVARRAEVIRQERQNAGDTGKVSILVSAGDNQMGCLTHTAFQTDSIDYGNMKALGYDVTTLGNHEFDFGPAALANAIKAAQAGSGLPPIVASNIHFSGTGADKSLADLYSTDVTDSAPIHPYRVLTVDGRLNGCNSCGIFKIGVIGYVGVDASNVAPNKTPVQFSEKGVDPTKVDDPKTVLPKLYGDLQPIVDKLRNTEKVDLVVALAHGGIPDSSTQSAIEASEDYNVCKNVTGIDFIVSGHAHNTDPKPIEVVNTAKKNCLVLNGSRFGQHLGRVEFTIPDDKSQPVSWDKATQALIPVDSKTAADTTEAGKVPPIVEKIESGDYLPSLLTTVTGAPVTNNASKAGDLYFYPLGRTDFDVTDTKMLLYLSADSMLAAADTWIAGQPGGFKNDIALESQGVIRSVIKSGKTGVISASDAFNVVPLGTSLSGDGTIGYALIRANVSLTALRFAFEKALVLGATNSDYNLGFSGMKIEYDPTAPKGGQITKMSLASNHADLENYDIPLYDSVNPVTNPPAYVAVVTSSYIAQFAGGAGVDLVDNNFNDFPSLLDARMLRGDTSEIKQVEAFMGYLHSVSQAPGGLPVRYNIKGASPLKRWVCTDGSC